jgi:hypothetical protein
MYVNRGVLPATSDGRYKGGQRIELRFDTGGNLCQVSSSAASFWRLRWGRLVQRCQKFSEDRGGTAAAGDGGNIGRASRDPCRDDPRMRVSLCGLTESLGNRHRERQERSENGKPGMFFA